MKGEKSQTFQLTPLTPFPELLETFRLEKFGGAIPQAKVQLQRDWTFGIVIITTPLPAGLRTIVGK